MFSHYLVPTLLRGNVRSDALRPGLREHSTRRGASHTCVPTQERGNEEGLIAQQHPFLEQIRRQFDARRLETVDKGRTHARRLILAVGPAVLIDAQLLEAENVLHD